MYPQRWLIQEVWLCSQYLVDVLLELLSKLRGDLVKAADQGIAECWISLLLTFSWLWVEIALFDGVVNIKSINTTSDSSFTYIECLDGKIEQISKQFSVCRHRIKA